MALRVSSTMAFWVSLTITFWVSSTMAPWVSSTMAFWVSSTIAFKVLNTIAFRVLTTIAFSVLTTIAFRVLATIAFMESWVGPAELAFLSGSTQWRGSGCLVPSDRLGHATWCRLSCYTVPCWVLCWISLLLLLLSQNADSAHEYKDS